MPELPPNVRALLAEKYPPGPRAFREIEDAMRRAGPVLTRLAEQLEENTRALRLMTTCRLCGCPAGKHHSGCPLERP